MTMEQTNAFDIRTQSMIDINLPVYSSGDIFLLGQRSALSEKISELRTSVLNNLDKYTTFNRYKLRVLENVNTEYNVICPIKDLATQVVLYIVVKSEPLELGIAVPAVINEAENRMRRFAEDALIIAAMEDPELFKSVVDKVIVEGHGDDNSKDKISPFGMFPIGSVAGAALGMALDLDGIDLGIDSCESVATDSKASLNASETNLQGTILGAFAETSPKRVNAITAKQKKEAFNKLPGRLNKAFEQQNPIDCEIIKQTMRTYSAAEVNAIIMELARTKPHLLRDFHSTAINSASRYEIHVRPWKSDYRNDFKDRYLYCIYLKNANGTERAVTFKNYPSYCIYMMYIIDRVQRGDEVTDLAMKNLRKEFCNLYKTILSETDKNIKNFYEGMDYRIIPGTGKMRKGRYDDYIRDIHETLEKLVGAIDSIPLKVGHGRFLGVLPERIFIDKKLTKFRFA